MHDAIEINVRGLKNLDITSSNYGPILVSIVMSKLPDDIKLIVSRSMSSATKEETEGEWKIDELMKAFKQEIESREMCNFVSNTSNAKYNKETNSSDGFTASSLVTNTTEDSPHIICGY